MLDAHRGTREWVTGYRLDQYSRDGRITFHRSWPTDWVCWYADLHPGLESATGPSHAWVLLEYLEHMRQAHTLAEVMYEYGVGYVDLDGSAAGP
jgi:hypothetical protein